MDLFHEKMKNIKSFYSDYQMKIESGDVDPQKNYEDIGAIIPLVIFLHDRRVVSRVPSEKYFWKY